jgi:MFS family permease
MKHAAIPISSPARPEKMVDAHAADPVLGSEPPCPESQPAVLGASSLSARAWLVVALLWVVACLNYLDRVMITTMRNSLREAIPMTDAQFGLLTTAFLLVYGGLSPLAGFLADRFSRSLVIIGSLFVWSVITWLTAQAKTYEQLFTTRLLMGVSEACFIPAALALAADYHRGGTRSRATGLLLGGAFVGSGLGGLGGWLAERRGWTYAFNLFGLVGIAYSFVLVLLLRDPPRLAFQKVAPTQTPNVRFGAALVSLFGQGTFILLFLYWGWLGLAGWMVVGWMPTYFQEQFHLRQGTAGLTVMTYLNAAFVVGLLIGGAWADRWSATDRRACISVSAIGLGLAAPSILLAANTSLLPLAILGLVLYGLTRSFADTEMMPILCLTTDPRYRATGYGLLNLFSCLSGGGTTYLGGALRDAHINVNRLFQFGALGLSSCAALLLLVRARTRLRPESNPELNSADGN